MKLTRPWKKHGSDKLFQAKFGPINLYCHTYDNGLWYAEVSCNVTDRTVIRQFGNDRKTIERAKQDAEKTATEMAMDIEAGAKILFSTFSRLVETI